jgi:predicted SprT family Zn-dependent metalloprotease
MPPTKAHDDTVLHGVRCPCAPCDRRGQGDDALSAAAPTLEDMSELVRVTKWAHALIALHLDPAIWSFGFDNAKTRGGQCDHGAKRITMSRYYAAEFDDDEVYQVLLHEVAHAIAGPRAGHGAPWRSVAESLGYEGGRTLDRSLADDLAPWVGRCPQGHLHYRYRKPTRLLSCARCSRRFSRDHLIEWERRAVPRRAS